MTFTKILLLPVAGLYGLGLFLRNSVYDLGILKSKKFKLPVISVGNLTVGGTGKTPHVEYLLKLLKEDFIVATLSRGYGRQATDFLMASSESTAREIGDEPRQFKQKFPDVPVAVDAKRSRGIQILQKEIDNLQAVLLDDAFQHRAVKAGLSILLTDYSNLYTDDYLLPAGRLRESRAGSSRADMIVVTKSPRVFSPMEQRIIKTQLKPRAYQKVYFSYLKYGDFRSLHQDQEAQRPNKEFYFERDFSFLVVTGIANPEPMIAFLEQHKAKMKHLEFPDHHVFTKEDLERIKGIFDTFGSGNKIILTTEKDAMRFSLPELKEEVAQLPIFYLPIEIAFHERDEKDFNEQIMNYVGRN